MTSRVQLGDAARTSLAVVRLVNGTLGLVAPALLVKRTSADPSTTAPFYAFRMFGVRTVVLGADLLLLQGPALRRARVEAVIIHGSDTACAIVGGLRGDLPKRAARLAAVISGVNTALALASWLLSEDRG